MGALHSHPYECPVSVLVAIWNFTQQCRRSQNDLWLNTAWVGWRYLRTSQATGIKEPPMHHRYTEVYLYPATTSHLWLRSKQVQDGPPRLRGTKARARGSWEGLEADEEWRVEGNDESKVDRVPNKIEKGGVVEHHQCDKIRMMHDLSPRMDFFAWMVCFVIGHWVIGVLEAHDQSCMGGWGLPKDSQPRQSCDKKNLLIELCNECL